MRVEDGATAAVGGADDGAEGDVERVSESDYESCTEGEESSADGADAAARAAVAASAAAVAAGVAASSALQVVELELMKLPGVAGLVKEACASVQRNAESEIEEIFVRSKVRDFLSDDSLLIVNRMVTKMSPLNRYFPLVGLETRLSKARNNIIFGAKTNLGSFYLQISIFTKAVN